MRYVSTRGEAPPLNFIDCLLAGLAHDGGLYVPETWPVLEQAEIAALAGKRFDEVAFDLIRRFTGGTIPDVELAAMTKAAYASFGHEAVTPLVQTDANTFVLELFHGPTLAFKDVAMQLLARLMDYALSQRGERATIVGATSGDTGGAAIEAFRSSKRVDVVILFPDGRVSDVQRRMMTTPTEPNVHALAIEGTFDDCQALVKGMFNHHAFRDRVRLSGVNSINWARILAQVTYYFVAATRLGAPYRPVSFTVPTGNFGDIFAGYVAKRLGLPIEQLIIGTNINDILTRTLATGSYDVTGVVATTSPSMDIQVSSNFERLLFEAGGRDSASVRGMMASLGQSGSFRVPDQTLAAIRRDFGAARADEAEVAATIREVEARSGYLLDTHTSVAMAASRKVRVKTETPMVVLSTAHPAKFPDAMEAITGRRPGLPSRLSNLMSDAERIDHAPNDLAAVERYVVEHARAVNGMAA